MASLFKKRRLTVITIVYWFLLLYITAALIWWFIALRRQSVQMTEYRMNLLDPKAANFEEQKSQIEEDNRRKTAQYISEGATFMLVIMVGAVFVYRATRKQIRLNHQQQNFMMAITHELKTPIAVVKLNMETLQKRKLEEAQQSRVIQNTLQETDRLNDLCNNILLASQLEAGGYSVATEEIDFSNLVNNCAQAFQNRFPNRKIEIDAGTNIHLMGDELLLKLAINNIIENALKYSPKEKPVRITLQKTHGRVEFKVMDQGAGIADSEKKKIFEKFYRLGDENTRNAQGTGLGLYLTQKIAEDHNGKVSVANNSPEGSIFMISFQSI
ncbi:MAG: two-component sensor histidine kinase [Bacteroidetes bacterium]|nr:MAG: two-component sensor histidine kinase [Bacteroidota bacterium]